MKTNKKALMGMLVAMTMSLGVMGSFNTNSSEMTVQQAALACGYVAGETEGGISTMATAASGLGIAGFGVTLATASTPIGWATVAGFAF